MAMSSRIIRTLAPSRYSAILTCSRRFSAGSVDQAGDSIKTYIVRVVLPDEKRCGSKEERDDWVHWFLSSTCGRGGGSKTAAASSSSSNCRDPRILEINSDGGFLARLSIQDVEGLLKSGELMNLEPDGKVDLSSCAIPPFRGWGGGEDFKEEEADEQQSNVENKCSRPFSAGSDADMGHQNENEFMRRTHKIGVKLPLEKWSDSKEEKDDWYHWFLSSSCGGSKAAAPIKNYRDPRILYTYPCGFCARLTLPEIYSLRKRDEFMHVQATVREQ